MKVGISALWYKVIPEKRALLVGSIGREREKEGKGSGGEMGRS